MSFFCFIANIASAVAILGKRLYIATSLENLESEILLFDLLKCVVNNR